MAFNKPIISFPLSPVSQVVILAPAITAVSLAGPEVRGRANDDDRKIGCGTCKGSLSEKGDGMCTGGRKI